MRHRSSSFTWPVFFWRLFLALLKVSGMLLTAAFVAGFWLYSRYADDLPDPGAIARYRPAETTRIYARDGQTLLLELVDPQGGRRTVVPFQQIPQVLKDATIAVEDAQFYENPGIDIQGIVRALLLNYEAGEVVSGGSTITQQLVRNILLPSEERSQVSFERKLREAILAIRVTQEYSKDQILALYLNEVYYGNQAYGVEAAAQTYFGKSVADLTPAEATLIAGLPQSPTVLNPFINLDGARARRDVTLGLMVKNGYLTDAQRRAIEREPLLLHTPETTIIAPHFSYYIQHQLEARYGPDLLYRGGLRVITTLDLAWQAEAQRIVSEQIAALRERNATNAGLIMLAPNGEILAMVGSVDFRDPAIDGQVNVTLAERQPGSALKPVVYATAMQRGWTPATIIWDTPVTYALGDGGVYAPRNYDNAWHGPQRLRMALANSLNIPALRAIEFTGVEAFVELAHRMGITTLNDPRRYGLAMALGSNEVRLLDLTNVYNTIRNAGRMRPPIAILKVTTARGESLETADPNAGRQALGEQGPQLAYLLTSILSDNAARTYMFGQDNVMELPDNRPAAVKTGTSNEWRDSWAIGFTPDVTVGVWVGNSDNSPMQEIAGSNGAGVIWRAMMESYHDGRPIRPFERPPGLEDVTICADTGGLANDACPRPITELFVSGTAPTAPDLSFKTVRVGGDGTCLATPATPPDQVREVRFVVYPAEFAEWAARAGNPQPPTRPCAPPDRTPDQAHVLITKPVSGDTITSTSLFVRGAAPGNYTLEFQPLGASDTDWRPIARGPGITDGILGVWRTGDLPPGDYVLRLLVTLDGGQTIEERQTVRVQRDP